MDKLPIRYGVVYKENGEEKKITFDYFYQAMQYADRCGFRFVRFEHIYE